MKELSSEKLRYHRRLSAVLIAAALVLTVILLTLPIAEFSTNIFTKKSVNTFVGDEKYEAAHNEAETAMVNYQIAEPDVPLSLSESVTTRVNSKGETTSMVTFTVVSSKSLTGWDFLQSSLPFGRIMLLLVIAAALAAVLGLVSLRDSVTHDPRHTSKGVKTIRGMACWLALLAIVLVPVFALNMTAVIQRQILVGLDDGSAPQALVLGMDRLLYGGSTGDNASVLLKSVTYHTTAALWLLLPVLFAMLSGLILLCKGAVGHTLARGGLYLVVIVLCIVLLYPYYVMFITGFRSNAETTDMTFSHMLPTTWVWSNVGDIVNRGVLGFLWNSVLLSTGATAIALLCGIPAAYAMSRMHFKGKKLFLGFVIMSQMFSPVVLLVGISRLMNTIGLSDSVLGLMLINAAFNQAFAIWLLRGTFMSISPEMEQAACIDGCSTVGSLIRVLLPMSAPGIVTTLIFVFINAWNEYTISTVLISTPAKKPITVGITQFSSFNMIEWQYLFASALIATIPVIILFMCIEKHLVSGLTSGGVKG